MLAVNVIWVLLNVVRIRRVVHEYKRGFDEVIVEDEATNE